MSGDAGVLRVAVDLARCCGAGQCVLIAPDVFDQDERDGTVILLQPSPRRALETHLREAADVCPTSAILVTV